VTALRMTGGSHSVRMKEKIERPLTMDKTKCHCRFVLVGLWVIVRLLDLLSLNDCVL
jgi:hypothetical protein